MEKEKIYLCKIDDSNLRFSNDPARASKPLEALVELLYISIRIESMVTSPTMDHLTFVGGKKRASYLSVRRSWRSCV